MPPVRDSYLGTHCVWNKHFLKFLRAAAPYFSVTMSSRSIFQRSGGYNKESSI